MKLTTELFVLGLFFALMGILMWASRALPAERWQFLATVPRRKMLDGHWDALNFTWYGALTAFAFVFSSALAILLCAAAGIQLELVLFSLLAIIAISLCSARLVAQVVERMPGTHTIGGAVFVIVLTSPILVLMAGELLNSMLGSQIRSAQQVLPLLSALAVAYAYGEGLGRIACISFGCCWGKRVDQLAGWQKRVFSRFHFVFSGGTKKIAYASKLEGIPVIPIQAITAAVHFGIGSISLWLFLIGLPAAALFSAMGGTQLWRFASEFLRADFRGVGRVTVYQWMALSCIVVSAAYAFWLPASIGTGSVLPDLERGLTMLWSPGLLLFLQFLGLAIFVIAGKSSVTRASLRLRMVN